ncbi:hypothetical protein Peur_054601 [Populus x canadensis]
MARVDRICANAIPHCPPYDVISTLLPWRHKQWYRLALSQFTYHKTTSFSIFLGQAKQLYLTPWPGQLYSFFSP